MQDTALNFLNQFLTEDQQKLLKTNESLALSKILTYVGMPFLILSNSSWVSSIPLQKLPLTLHSLSILPGIFILMKLV